MEGLQCSNIFTSGKSLDHSNAMELTLENSRHKTLVLLQWIYVTCF